MKIKDFIKTETGQKFSKLVDGCDKNWQVEYWESIANYKECLKDNDWKDEDIEEELEFVEQTMIKANANDNDFIIIIN